MIVFCLSVITRDAGFVENEGCVPEKHLPDSTLPDLGLMLSLHVNLHFHSSGVLEVADGFWLLTALTGNRSAVKTACAEPGSDRETQTGKMGR